MQSREQYALPDVQQLVLGRGASHLFAYSQDSAPQQRLQVHQLHQNLQAQQQHHHHHQQQQEQQQSVHHHHHHHQHQQQHKHQQQELPQAVQHFQQQQKHQHQEPQQSVQHLQQSQLREQQHTLQHPQQQQQQQPPPPFNLQQHPHHQTTQPSLQLPLLQQLGFGSEQQSEIPSTSLENRPSTEHFKSMITAAADPIGDLEEAAEEGDTCTGGSRWPKEETSALLRIRSEMDAMFRDSTFKGSLWEEVSRRFSKLGYHRSAKKCKEKFENVHKYYKRTKDGRAGRQDGKSYRFFSELEAIYAANNEEGGASGEDGLAVNVDKVAEHAGSTPLTAGGLSGAAMDAQVQRTDIGLGLSTSSGENHEEYHDNADLKYGKKRKRKSWSSMQLFVENLAKQLMEQQEALHRKFLATIEVRDRERMIREETYRRQEMSRLRREHELRAKEQALAAARDAALVAFLQKVTGETLQLPQMPVPSSHTIPSDDQEKEGSDASARRWPKLEVHSLIRLRSVLEPRFQDAGPKAQLWEEISKSMACLGFNRSAKRCKEKWENINKYFRKTKDSCRKRMDNAKTCPYFHQLEALYEKGILTSPNSKTSRPDGQSEDIESNKEDSQQTQNDNSETQAIVPARENGAGCFTSSITPQLGMNQENNAAGNLGSNGFPEASLIIQSGSSALSFDKMNGKEISGNNKSLSVEGFARDIFEMQQQHHQKLVDEFERIEHEREIREQAWRQHQHITPGQERSDVAMRDDTALIALAHKIAEDSSEFTMSAPSSTD